MDKIHPMLHTLNTMSSSPAKVFSYSFARIYQLYIEKVEKKGRTKHDVDTVIMWLTGYDEKGLSNQISNKHDLQTFFEQAPHIHPNAHHITGTICGHRIEDIVDPLMKKIRYMDKLIDEIAQGKSMEKVLRT